MGLSDKWKFEGMAGSLADLRWIYLLTGVMGFLISDVFADALTLTLKEVRSRALTFCVAKK